MTDKNASKLLMPTVWTWNVVFVSESGNLLLVYGKVDNIVYFDKKLAGKLLGLPPVAMTTAVVYHTFAMPFSMQRGRPLKFVVAYTTELC